ncbi:four helix bundle protein [Leptospira fletcheri]|uniref:Four helix bundle protein n=1 Tax=Leptospira fletcheri TaxID=2484981 RepID=A0A4R9GI34_9LEPT|nr:four helix bundle protein [Leptospira fletcheri]TGK12408.1 four helix bundle protein [Leptospira fletcheri]
MKNEISSEQEAEFPERYYFSTEIPIRKTDLSMDLHVSFATIMELVMEAHLRFFQFLGYSVMDIHGYSIIFANATIRYEGELLYQDVATIDVSLDRLEEKSFDLYFRLSKDGRKRKVSLVKIRVLFFDYKERKVSFVPASFREKLTSGKIRAMPSPPVGASNFPADIEIRSGFQRLEVWKISHDFILRLYALCDELRPKAENSWIERVRSVSSLIPARISGAWGARIRSEKIRNILRAKEHLEELRYLLVLANDLKIADLNEELSDLEKINEHLKKYLNTVRNSPTRRIN